ncbi:fibroblast growth factor-binding protein 2 [Anolis carolinensis]|uniref:Fibroblast growth factor binding protein 2 n=1 Tax=Anolis carolinensis TaxID=28377 RepID=G1KM24_ANOCA|nr:PREDICTED: fibroblast growth factor-binding protein 2 [Anolis carolinensis]|eukprot:XP_008107993.1 PREDICTED: fibroblast growth factor-binding protein 2 [Anolis carolinensis]
MKRTIILLIFLISFMETFALNPKAKKRSSGKEIHFQTKVKHACIMSMIGNGETKLRIECNNQGKTYWCEYTGKPSLCPSFNNNPMTYWNQIAMNLKKRNNACYSNLVLKPTMCQRVSSETHMRQVSSSIRTKSTPIQQADAVNYGKMAQKPLSAKHIEESQAGKGSIKKLGKPKPSPIPVVKPTQQGQVPGNESEAMKLAQKHCWESMHNICSYIIGIFKG